VSSNESLDVEIADDPVLGKVLANHPSDRLRLLLLGGGVYAVVAMVINVALLPLPAETALVIALAALALLALTVGWFVLHFWNREVILYEQGFSYREGSRQAYFKYSEIQSVHLTAEDIGYLGGLIRRRVRRFTLKTIHDESIVLTTVYRGIDALIDRLERLTSVPLRERLHERLAAGDAVDFGGLRVTPGGLERDGQSLAWDDYAGYALGGGALLLHSRASSADSDPWGRVPLDALDNVRVLVELLKRRSPAP
jgi:uncharacterized membrane protein YobD (UPF0266 family)